MCPPKQNSSKNRAGVGIKGHLELFKKFIPLGNLGLPLLYQYIIMIIVIITIMMIINMIMIIMMIINMIMIIMNV